MSDHEFDETALLEESGGENEIETETNETAGDEENDPVSLFHSLYGQYVKWRFSVKVFKKSDTPISSGFIYDTKRAIFIKIVSIKEPLDLKKDAICS